MYYRWRLPHLQHPNTVYTSNNGCHLTGSYQSSKRFCCDGPIFLSGCCRNTHLRRLSLAAPAPCLKAADASRRLR